MSRAKAAALRVPQDAYETPAPLALAICQRLTQEIEVGAIVEPSAGSGAFVVAARDAWPGLPVVAVEVNSRREEALRRAGAGHVFIADWVGCCPEAMIRAGSLGAPRLILGNPPYRQAQDHIEAGLAMLRPGEHLAFLLRLNFLGSRERVPFWNKGELRWISTVVPRPSFTGGGTDGTEYAVFLWERSYQGEAVLAPPVLWEPERKTRRRAA